MNNNPKGNILVVDDTPGNLELLMGMLKNSGYKVRPAPSGKLALEAAQNNPPDLILLDINMPGMDGYEVCRRLKENPALLDIPVIFISALNETFDKVKAFSAGGVDYVTKPFQFEEVNARITTHLKIRNQQKELEDYSQRLETLVQMQVKEISDSQMTTIFSLSKLAESRDDDTGKHLERTQIFCRMLAQKLSEHPPYDSQITPLFSYNILHASPMHDIGKVGIRDHILLKPARLTPAEFEIMKQHTSIGAETLRVVCEKYPRNAFLKIGIEVAQSHHEKWDGTGYPQGLAGEEIPISARIMAIADVYDALRSRRCYKAPLSHKEAYAIIVDGKGKHFDPVLVDLFEKLEEEFDENYNLMADEA